MAEVYRKFLENQLERDKRQHDGNVLSRIWVSDSRFSGVDQFDSLRDNKQHAIMSMGTTKAPKPLWTWLKQKSEITETKAGTKRKRPKKVPRLAKKQWMSVWYTKKIDLSLRKPDVVGFVTSVRTKGNVYLNLLSSCFDYTAVEVEARRRKFPMNSYKVMQPKIQRIYNLSARPIDINNKLRLSKYFRFGRDSNDGFSYVRYFIHLWLTNAGLHFNAMFSDFSVSNLAYRRAMITKLLQILKVSTPAATTPTPLISHWPVTRGSGRPQCTICTQRVYSYCPGCPGIDLCSTHLAERHLRNNKQEDD